jgi:hypothetical protein
MARQSVRRQLQPLLFLAMGVADSQPWRDETFDASVDRRKRLLWACQHTCVMCGMSVHLPVSCVVCMCICVYMPAYLCHVWYVCAFTCVMCGMYVYLCIHTCVMCV